MEDMRKNWSRWEAEEIDYLKKKINNLDLEIIKTKEELLDRELEAADFQQKLLNTGLFSQDKKKDLQALIEEKNKEIAEKKKALTKSELERKRLAGSEPRRLADLKTDRVELAEDIANDYEEVAKLTLEINKKMNELDEINVAIEDE